MKSLKYLEAFFFTLAEENLIECCCRDTVLETPDFSFSENVTFLLKTLQSYCQIIVKSEKNVLKFAKAGLLAPIFKGLQFILSLVS